MSEITLTGWENIKSKLADMIEIIGDGTETESGKIITTVGIKNARYICNYNNTDFNYEMAENSFRTENYGTKCCIFLPDNPTMKFTSSDIFVGSWGEGRADLIGAYAQLAIESGGTFATKGVPQVTTDVYRDGAVYDRASFTSVQWNIAGYGVMKTFPGGKIFTLNCPIVKDRQTAYDYLINDIVPNPSDIIGETIVIEGDKYYIHTKNYSNTENSKNNANFIDDTETIIKFAKPNNMVVGYLNDLYHPHNVILKTSTGILRGKYICIQTNHTSGVETETENEITNNPFHTFNELRRVDSMYYFSNIIASNIPIYASEPDAEKALIGEPVKPIYDPSDNDPSDIGTDDPFENNRTSTNDTGGLTYILNKTQFNQLKDILYNDDESFIDNLKKGLTMYQNPIDAVIDCFYMPISPTLFITDEVVGNVNFGSCSVPVSNWRLMKTNNTLQEMFSVQLDSYIMYKDFRDYFCNIYLYLPYVGVVSVDTDKVIYSNLICKCFMDVRTGTIKYWLFADTTLIGDYTGCVHVSIPLTNTDLSGWVSEKFNGVSNIVGGTASVVGGVALPNAVAVSGGVMSASMGVVDLIKPPKKQVSGNSSPSASVLDPTHCYLLIEKPQFIYPSNITSKYGRPDNSVGRVQDYSGYLVCDNVDIETSAPQNIKDEIISLLQSGIYV